MHRYSTGNARSIPQCTVAVLVMHTVFHNTRLQFSSGRCVPQWTVEFSSFTLCSTLHGWDFVQQCTVAVLIMTLCSTMHGRVPQRKVAVLITHAVFSTMNGCSSRHDAVLHNARLQYLSWRCVPQCTVVELIEHAVFHNARLSSRYDAVFHNAWLSFRHDAVFNHAPL